MPLLVHFDALKTWLKSIDYEVMKLFGCLGGDFIWGLTVHVLILVHIIMFLPLSHSLTYAGGGSHHR